MSADAMTFYTQSRKDDLISMMYSLVYLVNDQTVWAYEDHAIDEDSQRNLILEYKKKSTAAQMCKGKAAQLTSIM